MISIARRGAPAATNDIDFAGAPAVIDSATLDTTTIAQPSVAWTTQGGASLATMKAPTLPKAAEAWAPHGANDAGGAVTFQDPTVIFAEADILPGYADFRKGAGLVLPLTNQYQPEARAILPANGTIKLTSYRNLPPNL